MWKRFFGIKKFRTKFFFVLYFFLIHDFSKQLFLIKSSLKFLRVRIVISSHHARKKTTLVWKIEETINVVLVKVVEVLCANCTATGYPCCSEHWKNGEELCIQVCFSFFFLFPNFINKFFSLSSQFFFSKTVFRMVFLL